MSFIFSKAFAVGSFESATRTSVSVSAATAKYTTDLTQLGREGRLREELTFEKETLRLIKALSEGGIRQPVVVDEDKAVQDSIVEQAALRIAKNQVPKTLADRTILKVETAALFSNAKTPAEAAGGARGDR
jgi:ATP-dependent Clp protease ATP-binding subunit ClpA